jgi:hypothetical protein
MWSLPTFAVELRLLHLGRVVRSRSCKITTPMGLRRSVNTALRVAMQNGTGLDLLTLAKGWDAGDPWRCEAVVPRAFAERFAITARGSRLERKGRPLCEGSIS